MAPQLQRAEDAHQHRLGVGPGGRAVAQDVLALNDRRADLPLGVVVVERDVRPVQEGEQVVAVAADPLAQPGRVAVGIDAVDGVVGQLIEPAVDQRDAGAVLFGREVGALAESVTVSFSENINPVYCISSHV